MRGGGCVLPGERTVNREGRGRGMWDWRKCDGDLIRDFEVEQDDGQIASGSAWWQALRRVVGI